MGKHQREKGKRWEREVARRLREVMPDADVHRGLQAAGAREADVECPYFWAECKHHKQTNPRAALRQAKRDTDDRIPIAVCKDDRQPPFVVMDFDDWCALVLEWWAKR